MRATSRIQIRFDLIFLLVFLIKILKQKKKKRTIIICFYYYYYAFLEALPSSFNQGSGAGF